MFYPQFFDIFNVSTMQLFERTGLSGSDLLKKYGIVGFPLVEVRASFRKPCLFDDSVMAECEIGAWGYTSFTVHHRILNGGELATEGFERRIWAKRHPERAGLKPEPVPDEIKASLSGPGKP